MKFTISINQEKLVKLAPGAALVDGAILDYLFWFCNSGSEEIEKCRIVYEGRKYTWINYDWLLQDMPLLKGKTRQSLIPIVQRLEKWGFIKTHRLKGGNGGGRKYIVLEPKIDDLYRERLAKSPNSKGRKKLDEMKAQYFGK